MIVQINIVIIIALCLSFFSLGMAISNLVWNNIHRRMIQDMMRIASSQLEDNHEK